MLEVKGRNDGSQFHRAPAYSLGKGGHITLSHQELAGNDPTNDDTAGGGLRQLTVIGEGHTKRTLCTCT
jgi:hypothetical protein